MKHESNILVPLNYKSGEPVTASLAKGHRFEGVKKYKNLIYTKSNIGNDKIVFVKIDNSPWPEEIKINKSVKYKFFSKKNNVAKIGKKIHFFPPEKNTKTYLLEASVLGAIVTACALMLIIKKSTYIKKYFFQKSIRDNVALYNKMWLYSRLNDTSNDNLLGEKEKRLKEFVVKNCFKENDEKYFFNECRRILR